MKTSRWIVAALSALLLCSIALASPQFQPGAVWLDSAGQPIQAHGGGILSHNGAYYWYGEDRTPGGTGAVACYSSTNLYDWQREGIALDRSALPRVAGQRTFVERPKVLFNGRTGRYVMWMHLEQRGYHYARAGVASSPTPTGPFTFLKAIRPITNDFNFESQDPNQQKELGGTVRDFNAFLDEDGQAYVFYSSENNWTMYVVRLNADFTVPEQPAIENRTWARILVRRMREAPAPFRYNNRYYLMTSACTGWKPNKAGYAVAENILGPYQEHGDPCTGQGSDTTFGAQSTFVLPWPGRPGAFIFMADRWNPSNLPDSRYIWLPLLLQPDGAFTIPWHDRWGLDQ